MPVLFSEDSKLHYERNYVLTMLGNPELISSLGSYT